MNKSLPAAMLTYVLIFVAGFFFANILRRGGSIGRFPVRPFPIEHTRSFALPLNNPAVVSVKEAHHMHDSDLVFGLMVNGHARAYPRWIMLQYHVANDTIDNVPVLVDQCEVCSSASAFLAALKDEPFESLTFMICGQRHGTFAICDNQTVSSWHSFSGVAYDGPLRGKQLQRLPLVTQTWKAWKKAHPNTDVVFSSENLKLRPHSAHQTPVGDPFIPYYFMRDANLKDTRLPLNTVVYGIVGKNGASVAVPLRSLAKFKLLDRELMGSRYLILKYDDFAVSAFLVPKDSTRYDVTQKQPLVISGSNGGLWNAFGNAQKGSKISEPLQFADGRISEWYEWVSEYSRSDVVE